MDLLLRSLGFSDGGVEKQRSGECEAGRDARQKAGRSQRTLYLWHRTRPSVHRTKPSGHSDGVPKSPKGVNPYAVESWWKPRATEPTEHSIDGKGVRS